MALNVPLLLKVKEAILAHPKHFDMTSFAGGDENNVCDGHLSNRLANFQSAVTAESRCGTTACIGGWAVALTPIDDLPVIEQYEFRTVDAFASSVAAEVLGITEDEEGELFYENGWPGEIEEAYLDARAMRDFPGMARAAADAIDWFIAEHAEAPQ